MAGRLPSFRTRTGRMVGVGGGACVLRGERSLLLLTNFYVPARVRQIWFCAIATLKKLQHPSEVPAH